MDNLQGQIGLSLPIGWSFSVEASEMYSEQAGHVATKKHREQRGRTGTINNRTDTEMTCLELDGVDIQVFYTPVEKGVRYFQWTRKIWERECSWGATQTIRGRWEPVTTSGTEWINWGELETVVETPVFGAVCNPGRRAPRYPR